MPRAAQWTLSRTNLEQRLGQWQQRHEWAWDKSIYRGIDASSAEAEKGRRASRRMIC